MTAPAVQLVGIERRYGDVLAVRGIDLSIADGEFFSLLGPSGCGKTTTLRLISGLEEPTGGRVEVRGRDMARVPPHRRPVTTVFQNYALFPHLNVFENVAFGLRERRVPARRCGAASPACSSWSICRGATPRVPASSPAGSSSASRSRARSS